MRFRKGFIVGILFMISLAIPLGVHGAPAELNLEVKEFSLKNGMLFLVVERPTTPQIACRIAIRAGSALEDSGRTGLAHMLEHMMFKGTKNFGTLDFEKDRELQAQIEAAYQTILTEKTKRQPDPALIKAKHKEMDTLRSEVQKIYMPHAFSSQLGKNGAMGVNAFTSKDQTQYIASIPSDMLEQWFALISEQLFEPSWREFYVEKAVVQREWAFRYVNDPGGAAWLDLYATAFNAHPYRNPTIGWKADMEKFSTRDAVNFHNQHYSPTNAVCVLAGDVTVEEAKVLAGIYFGRYPPGRRAPEELTREPAQQGPRRSVRYLKGARTPLVRIGFHAERMGTKDFYALDALVSVLSQGRSARLTQHIVEKGLAVEAWAHHPDNRYGDLFILGGSPKEPETLKNPTVPDDEKRRLYRRACEELEQILLAEVERLKTDLVSERELNRIKKLNQRSFLDRMRSNEHLAASLATLEVQVGWQYLTTYLENLAQVTGEDIRDVANKYLQHNNKSSIYVIPGGTPDQPPVHYSEERSPGRSAAGKTVQPDISQNHSIYPTPKGWKHPLTFERRPEKIKYPEAELETLENSNLFYLSDRELPLVELILLVKAGAVDVADAKTGLTGLLNGCIIRGGTEAHSPGELALILDENAIHLSFSVGKEETVIRLSVMKEDWEKGLALLQEVLTRPRFDPSVLAVTKDQALIALKRQGGDAATVCRREATIQHFKGHPYGRDPLLGLETIPALTRDDLKTFVEDYFVPSNMVAAVAGDIDKAEAVKGLTSLFKALPQDKAPIRNLPVPDKTPPVLALIHKPGQVQSQVGLSLHSVRRSHPDYWKLTLLMDILGGSDSLMYTRLRDDLGLVYFAGFFQAYRWNAGILIGYIACKGDKTTEAIHETVQIMTGLRNEVPLKALEQKRLDALNSFVFNVDTPVQLVKTYGTYYMRQEPLDTLEKIQDAFIRAEKQELESLANRFVDPRQLQIFVVGDKTTQVKIKGGKKITLEEDLEALAERLQLPYTEIPLR